MEQAVDMIKNEDIREKIKKIQDDVVVDEELKQLTATEQQKTGEASKFMLGCKCGGFEIECKNMRCIEKNHYAVLDVELWDFIIEKPIQSTSFNPSSAVMQSKWYHRSCKKEMGTVFKYKNVRLLYLAQAAFTYFRKGDCRPVNVGKWKNLPFNVPDLDHKHDLLPYAKALKAKNML